MSNLQAEALGTNLSVKFVCEACGHEIAFVDLPGGGPWQGIFTVGPCCTNCAEPNFTTDEEEAPTKRQFRPE